MSKFIAPFNLFFLLLVFFMSGTMIYGQRQNLIIETTFEGTNYLAGWGNYQHCCDYSAQQSTERVKAGSNAFRIEVRKNDEQVSGSIRSEITQDIDPLNE